MGTAKVEYIGKDLEAMDLAENYHEWIFRLMEPYLGKNIVEVGAGSGGFSLILLRRKPDLLTLVEPSAMFDELKVRTSGLGSNGAIRYVQNVFGEVADEIGSETKPDSIIYINVLEHIEDDRAELELIDKALIPGGRLFIFVPAQQFLFSNFDKGIGHFRRYGRRDLLERCETAGFLIREVRNVDFFGIVPWLVKYRILKSTSMEPKMVKLYDKAVVPIARRIEEMIHPPIGKNLLVVAEKRNGDPAGGLIR